MRSFQVEYEIPELIALTAKFRAEAQMSPNGRSLSVGSRTAWRHTGLAALFLGSYWTHKCVQSDVTGKREDSTEILLTTLSQDDMISILAKFEADRAVNPEAVDNALISALKQTLVLVEGRRQHRAMEARLTP